jgi:hypothetical protein
MNQPENRKRAIRISSANCGFLAFNEINRKVASAAASITGEGLSQDTSSPINPTKKIRITLTVSRLILNGKSYCRIFFAAINFAEFALHLLAYRLFA